MEDGMESIKNISRSTDNYTKVFGCASLVSTIVTLGYGAAYGYHCWFGAQNNRAAYNSKKERLSCSIKLWGKTTVPFTVATILFFGFDQLMQG